MTRDAEALAFSLLIACAALMAAAYVLDLAGLSMSGPVLALVSALALAGSLAAFMRAAPAQSRTFQLAGFLVVALLSSAYLLWLASPSLLPVTIGPDVVHHLQLIHVIQRTHRLAHDSALAPYLFEMMNYTPGSHILAATVANWIGIDALRVVQPITALLTGLKLGLVYLVAARACESLRSGPVSALAAPVLAFVPVVYTIGSSFHFFFYAQVVSEVFAIGMLLAAVCWVQSQRRIYVGAFAGCAVGVFLSWPVWLGPGVAVLLLAFALAPMSWRSCLVLAVLALAPLAAIGIAHSATHAEGGRILAASGAVTAPSVEGFGAAFLVLATLGLAIVLVRVRAGALVAAFMGVALAQAAALAVLAISAGATGFYLPFKMMYLVVFPCAVLGAIALAWLVDVVAARFPRPARALAVVPLVIALSLAAGRVPRARQKSAINEPSYAAGLWARDHLEPACIDYFSKHWLTGYWLHLDVLRNPRASARMRAESFEFHDSVAKWLQGNGLPYGFVENLADMPHELRPEMTAIYTAGNAALVRNLKSRGCP